jgi:hypothetical protein
VQQYHAQRGFLRDPLIEGYRKFRAEVWPTERARYEALAHWGQSLETMVIACSGWRIVILGHGPCGGPQDRPKSGAAGKGGAARALGRCARLAKVRFERCQAR